MNIEDLRKLCEDGKIKWTRHALERIRDRGINSRAVVRCILSGDIIKQYEDDKPFPSCLVDGITDGKHIHAVASTDGESLYVITAYYPSVDEWEADFRTRKGRL